eukprot:SAG31_NODE_5303_length_2621_cov_1.705393_5_plen_61_part_00
MDTVTAHNASARAKVEAVHTTAAIVDELVCRMWCANCATSAWGYHFLLVWGANARAGSYS